jgi:hypothetical protein
MGLLAIVATPAIAQEGVAALTPGEDLYEIRLMDGSVLFGRVTGVEGEAYVGTYIIVLPFFAVGLTDRTTVAAGAPVLFGELEPFYVAPKVQVFRTARAAISVGTLALFFDDEIVGINYAVGTFGTPDHALTLGLGFGF